MAYNSINSGRFSTPGEWLKGTLLFLPAIIIGLTFHEFMHAFSAYKLGDQLPKIQKRVTLNPISHIDPIGIIALIFVGFGWGRPVMINPRAFRGNRRKAGLIVAVAGVAMNFVIAFICMLLLFLAYKDIMYISAAFPDAPIINVLFWLQTEIMKDDVLFNILFNIIYINIVLMVFNLLPIPPLDGFGILTEIFDLRRFSWHNTFYNYGSIILLLLIVFGGTRIILFPAITSILNFIGAFWIGVLT